MNISQADIARMAGVSRAAVANWRNRYPDFPQSVGGRFDSAAVEAWIESRRRTEPQNAPVASAESLTPLSEPLMSLLRKASARKPAVWIPHKDVIDNRLATAPTIRHLIRDGHIERHPVNFAHGPSVLLGIPSADQSIDIQSIEEAANAALAAVRHHVKIYRAQRNVSRYERTTIKHNGRIYTGYRVMREWTVVVAEDAP